MRTVAAALLALYAVLVARLTLADPLAGAPVFSAADYWAGLLSGGRLDGARVEVLANIALFVPAGLLLMVVLRRPVLTIALLVAVSAGIELAQQQWFSTRVPSLADVEHNGVGAALGVLAAATLVHASRWLSGAGRSAERPA